MKQQPQLAARPIGLVMCPKKQLPQLIQQLAPKKLQSSQQQLFFHVLHTLDELEPCQVKSQRLPEQSQNPTQKVIGSFLWMQLLLIFAWKRQLIRR